MTETTTQPATDPTATLEAVGELLASVFGDGMLAIQVAEHFRCSEVNTVCTALVMAGQEEAAVTFLYGHASADAVGDSHDHIKDETQAAAYLGDYTTDLDLSDTLTADDTTRLIHLRGVKADVPSAFAEADLQDELDDLEEKATRLNGGIVIPPAPAAE